MEVGNPAFNSKDEGLDVKDDGACIGIVFEALPRPTVYMANRLFAALALPASAARLYQPTAAGKSGAASPQGLHSLTSTT